MQQGIGFDDPGNPFQPSLLLMNLFFKGGGGGCRALLTANNSEVCRHLLTVSASPSPDLTASHHQEGEGGLSPGSDHPEHTTQRWAQGSYLLSPLHFPTTEEFQNSLSLSQYHKSLSSQIACFFLRYLPVSYHHNNSVPRNLFFFI